MKNKRKMITILVMLSLLIGLVGLPNTKVSAATATKYLKVNNTILDFKEIVYVDGTNGNDTSGDGSKNKPFKTVTAGFDYLNINCREGGAIVMNDGTYDVSSLSTGSSYNLDNKYNQMKVTLIAQTMGKVQFTNIGEWIIVENAVTSRIKINFYGIILKTFLETRYPLGGDDWTNEYYNCVITEGYGGYNNYVSNANIKVENSLFVGQPSFLYKDFPISGSAINCASTTQYMDPCNGTKTNALYNVSIDSDYNIISNGWKNAGTGTNPDGTVANIGVYGGQFAWGSTAIEITPNNILKLVMETNEEKQLSISDDLTDNFKLAWTSDNTSVATVDSNGKVKALKPGNAVITCTNSDGSYIQTIKVLVVDLDYQLAVDLKVGDKCRLTVDDLTNTTSVTWTSSNPAIATVSNKGKVIAISEGLIYVTATDSAGKEIGRIYVRVRD